MTRRVVVRADGGPRIGFGHLVRTTALATAFRKRGWAVTHVTTTPEAARAVVGEADVIALDGGSPDGPTPVGVESIESLRPEVVVVDSYAFDASDQRRFGACADVTCVVVDDARRVSADVVVNGNLYAPDIEYEWVGPEPTWCLGPRYLPLREGFRDGHERSPWRDPPEHALVTMGGNDARNTTPAAIRAFDGLAAPATVTVVVGPGFENREAIRTAARESDREVVLLADPDREILLHRFYDADLAVSALGSTTYELLATATPQVGVVRADNQRPIARALDARGAAVVLDPDDSGTNGPEPTGPDGLQTALRGAIRGLLADPDRRRTLYERGPAIVDGRGTERIYDEIISHIERNRRA